MNAPRTPKGTVMGISPEADAVHRDAFRERVASKLGINVAVVSEVMEPDAPANKARVKPYDPSRAGRPGVAEVFAAGNRNLGVTVMMDGVENGAVVWRRTIASQSMGCYEKLTEAGVSHEIASDAALYYGGMIDQYEIAASAFAKARKYAEQRVAGYDDLTAKAIAEGKLTVAITPTVTPSSKVYAVQRAAGLSDGQAKAVVAGAREGVTPTVTGEPSVIAPDEDLLVAEKFLRARNRGLIAVVGLGVALLAGGGLYAVSRIANNVAHSSAPARR